MNKNSLDLLRLLAATLVLYSHQYPLLGLPEPALVGTNTFGGVGVTIFFFLSGFLVWTSWDRDPDWRRFFLRRSLRIFPALWVVVLLSVFLLGPLASILSLDNYFGSVSTWRYLTTALLITPNILPGLFADNAMPFLVNGSLWTLPVEYFCYITVAVIGTGLVAWKRSAELLLTVCLMGVVLVTTYGTSIIGYRFVPHLEMVAMFWWGAYYGYCLKERTTWLGFSVSAIAMLALAMLGAGGVERAAMLGLSAVLVHFFRHLAAGSWLTDRLGDLSYGVYIFAFPAQQLVIHWGKGLDLAFNTYFAISLTVTLGLAYLSWHLVEKQALLLKPSAKRIK